MEWHSPEYLLNVAPELKTGARVFVKRPFKWYKLKCWFDRFAGWVVRSKSGCYHGGVVWKRKGRLFIVEATFFRYANPRPLKMWIAERQNFLVSVQLRETDEGAILDEWGKRYDFWAVWAKFWERITGVWVGRTGGFSAFKTFCLELIARAEGRKDAYRADMEYFEPEPPKN